MFSQSQKVSHEKEKRKKEKRERKMKLSFEKFWAGAIAGAALLPSMEGAKVSCFVALPQLSVDF